MKKTICLDCDGVCNMYDGWKGEDELFTPRPHLWDFISSLLNSDKRIAIFSTRSPEKLREWFQGFMPWTSAPIATGDLFFPDKKPPADCYIDDRAVRFNGSFEEILPQVLNFKAHWEKMTLEEAILNANGDTITVDEQGMVSIG